MRTGEELRDHLRAAVQSIDDNDAITDKQQGYVCGLLGKVLGGGESGDVARHQVLEFLFGVSSSKRLTKAQGSVLIEWLIDGANGEVHEALDAWGAERGQLRMEL